MGSFTIFLLISTILACAYALGVSIWIILAVRRRKKGEKDFKYIPLYENNMPIKIKETTITLNTTLPTCEETIIPQKKKNIKPKVTISFEEKEISPNITTNLILQYETI